MADLQKKKRKAMSIQDTANGNTGRIDVPARGARAGAVGAPQRGSRNTGKLSDLINRNPEKAKAPGTSFVNTIEGYGYAGPQSGRTQPVGGYRAPSAARGIMDYAWILYCVVMAICLTVSLVVYNKNIGTKSGYSFPVDLLTVSGVVNTIYDDYRNGGLGSSYSASNVSNMDAPIPGAGTGSDALPAEGTVTNPISNPDSNTSSAPLPNSTTGATMALDTGADAYGDYPNATAYADVVSQVDFALSSGDSGFVGRKLAYEDESGNLIGYPQSVVEHFTQYMAANEAKRQAFISEIGGDSYSVKNGEAILVRLPLLKFTVNMGYDNTTLSISGFSDQSLNAGQSAVVQPLLPCMYTISVATNGGSQSSEVEANMKEGNLQINIGVTEQGQN